MDKLTPIERFWSKVDTSGDCWLWKTGKDRDGYGKFSLGGKSISAHKYIYEITYGSLAQGLLVDHVCHNRACVNPSHMRPATRKQNAENRCGAARDNKSCGVRGVTRQGKKWKVQIGHNNRQVYIGIYETIEEASAAARRARGQLFTHSNETL